MPVETFSLIHSLDPSLPGATDGPSQGDDHMRGIKATIRATFPNISAVVTATAANLNQLASGVIQFAAGAVGAPSITFAAETTLGLIRSAAGVITIVGGRLTGNGAVPTGAICDFLNEPPTGWYELNGQAVSRTGECAALFAMYGTFYGPGDGTTTFNLPSVTGRYRRGRDPGAGLLSGSTQADAIKSHTASVSVNGADHNHGITDLGHSHGWSGPASRQGVEDRGGGNLGPVVAGGVGNVWFGSAGASTDGAATGVSVNNSGVLNMTGTATYTGDTETRPRSIIVVTCVKA